MVLLSISFRFIIGWLLTNNTLLLSMTIFGVDGIMVVVVFVSLGVVTSDISVLVPSGVLMVSETMVFPDLRLKK